MLIKQAWRALKKKFSKPTLQDHFAALVEFQVFEASYVTTLIHGFGSDDKEKAYKWKKHLDEIVGESGGANWEIYLMKVMIDQINQDNNIKSLPDYYNARNKLLEELYSDEPFLSNPFLKSEASR